MPPGGGGVHVEGRRRCRARLLPLTLTCLLGRCQEGAARACGWCLLGRLRLRRCRATERASCLLQRRSTRSRHARRRSGGVRRDLGSLLLLRRRSADLPSALLCQRVMSDGASGRVWCGTSNQGGMVRELHTGAATVKLRVLGVATCVCSHVM